MIAIAGVPLFSGFMYAAVGSYICQSWRRFDLRVSRYPALPTTSSRSRSTRTSSPTTTSPTCGSRWRALAPVLWHSRVHYTVGDARYWMPLALSFLLIGIFLWLAENAATLLEAWNYPGQVRRLGGGARGEARFVGAAGVDELRTRGHRQGTGGRLYHVPGEPHVTADLTPGDGAGSST